MRVSQRTDLPPAQFLTLNVLGGLLLGSFLLWTAKNDQLEAAAAGALSARPPSSSVASTTWPTELSQAWSVEPARKAGKESSGDGEGPKARDENHTAFVA